MENAAGIRNDVEYQALLDDWGDKHQDRNRLRDPHRTFAVVSKRGRNSRGPSPFRRQQPQQSQSF